MGDFREWRKLETYKVDMKDPDVVLSMQRNADIDAVYRGLWSENILDAKRYKLPFVSDLYGTRQGPVLVCGAGPSLNRNARYIRHAADNGWGILATDRALNEIRKMGVKEDLSLTTECQPECGDFLNAAGKGDAVAVNLISSPETRKKLVDRGAKVFHCAPMSPIEPFWYYVYGKDFWNGDVGCMRIHLIVTFSLVDIAFWMGFNPIVTIGNDLCYDNPYSCGNDTALFNDGTRGEIRELVKGRWTFSLFEEAAMGFALFQNWHPFRVWIDASYCGERPGFKIVGNTIKRVVLPASFGISPWPKAHLKDLVGPGK